MNILRPYQTDISAEFERLVAQGERRILMVAPTGPGKTVIAAAIIAGTGNTNDGSYGFYGFYGSYNRSNNNNHNNPYYRDRRVLVVAHRREIVNQTSDKLTATGTHHGIIQAGDDKKLRPMAAVQVASIQTLHARAMRSNNNNNADTNNYTHITNGTNNYTHITNSKKNMPMPLADLVIIDEAHHACAMTYQKVIEAYPNAIILGLTATPCRGDGRGLGGIFTTMIQCPQVPDLIDQGYLVKSRVYAPIDPDLRGVQTVKGDYHEGQLSQRMDKGELIGDIVMHWFKFGERRRTIAFACSIGHSIHIRDEFIKAGVRAEHLDGATPKSDREAILGRLASGETEVVTNCMVLTEGFDCCPIGCIILARPTKKMGLFRQMIGRGLRPAEGKTDCIILDHSGAVFRHGLPEDRVEWTLDPEHRAIAPAHQKRQGNRESKLVECSQCSTLRMGGQPCPCCGFLPRRPAEYVAHIDGDLGLVVNGHVRKGDMTQEQQLQFYLELRGYAAQRGYKDGWAFMKCKEKGFSPPWSWKSYDPIEPSPAVSAWARSRNIAYAKRRDAA